MREQRITSGLGQIAVAIDENGAEIPVVFLHGVFLDRSLWADYGSDLTGRTHIYIDMPAHGNSSDIGHDWSLDDCVEMLINVLDELGVQECIVIGHSWGSMTALRAATKFPTRFKAVGLFNMPFKRASGLSRLGFILQKLMVVFPRFYAKQAAKSLYSKAVLRQRPDLSTKMQDRLSKRPSKEISRVIDAVILDPTDATQLLHTLRVPAFAMIGETDYVGNPPKIETATVPGGHISPHEAVQETRAAIKRVVELASAKSA